MICNGRVSDRGRRRSGRLRAAIDNPHGFMFINSAAGRVDTPCYSTGNCRVEGGRFRREDGGSTTSRKLLYGYRRS